jgi:hypothetical protein
LSNQIANDGPSTVKRLDQAMEPATIEFVPLWRNSASNSPDVIHTQPFSPRERRLEGIPASDVPVDTIPGVHSPQRRVRETPLARIEAISLVDESCGEASATLLASEHGLPAIRVASPLVEHDHSGEIVDIRDMVQELFRQIVEYRTAVWILDVQRSEVSAWFARNTATSQVDAKVGGLFDKPGRNLNRLDAWHRQSEQMAETSRQHLIGENSDVLWIIRQLADVMRSIGHPEKL